MSTRTALKEFFETGDVPTEGQFADLIDSLLHLTDDTTDEIIEGAVNFFMSAAESSKLSGIAAGAEVNPALVSQAEAEAGTATIERIWTAQRVAQAIAALGGGGGGGGLTLDVTPKTTAFTAVAGTMYTINTQGGAIYCNPPSSPSVNDEFGITDARRALNVTNKCTVRFTTSGVRFCGASSGADIDLNKPDQAITFKYTGATYGWVVSSGMIN